MIDYTDVDAKLEEYSEAFDFYMECGEMPPSMPHYDCLISYMQEVIDNNPQIDGSDETWVEVLKEDLISFFTALLEQLRAMQIEAMKELAMIAKFNEASIEKKRMMWTEVCCIIEAGYSKYDVNLAGYTAQFKTDDKEAVFSALTSDWGNACKAKLIMIRSLQEQLWLRSPSGLAQPTLKTFMLRRVGTKPFLEVLADLLKRGVEIRLIHQRNRDRLYVRILTDPRF